MLSNYLTISSSDVHEIVIKKSRFICTLVRISTEEEAREAIQKTKKQHPKANHHCFAFVLGENQEIQRFSDDGEPGGTAGIPILEVLKKNNLYNVLAIVTRYFGGTKLGAGGLIRAYSSSTSEAIQTIGIVKGILEQIFYITIKYEQLNKFEYFLEQKNLSILSNEYSDSVTLKIATSHPNELKNEITELLNGKVAILEGETSYIEYSITD